MNGYRVKERDRPPLSQCGDAKGPHLVYRKETMRASVSEIDSKNWQVLPNLGQADLAWVLHSMNGNEKSH